jgi:phospholipid/cholesterol/gamma-HCH transport system ATP-binding protein
MREPLFEFKNVSYWEKNDKKLDRIDLSIYENDITSIIGLSGSGKSLILYLIAGLRPFQVNKYVDFSGYILFRGKSIHFMNRKEWSKYIDQIGFTFQGNALFDSLTVFDNVALKLRQTTSLAEKEIEEKVMHKLELTELLDVAHLYPMQISLGQQKRVAIARALIKDPPILVFDEPAASLDPIRKSSIFGLITEYQKMLNNTVILVTHEIPDALFISNRVLAVYGKKVVFQGRPEEFQEFDHPLKEEILTSLESLRKDITGLYSKRHFKVRHQTDLSKWYPNAMYAVALFEVDDLNTIIEYMGYDAAEEIIRALGSYINKYFSAIGGFSFRYTINEYATVLPYSDMDEAERIMADLKKDFREHGLPDIKSLQKGERPGENHFEFFIQAGLAAGKPQIEMESVMSFARFNQTPIARFQCERGGKTQ